MKKTRAQSNLRKRLRNQKNDRKACRNFFAAQKEAAELGSAWCDRQGANKRGEKDQRRRNACQKKPQANNARNFMIAPEPI